MEIKRAISFERGIVNMETGEFPLTLASDGEASDGHIFGVRGAQFEDEITMLFNHQSTPDIPSLGNVHSVRREKRDGLNVLTGTGRFLMQGEGAQAEQRRDFALLVNTGGLKSASVRWDGEGIPRTRLPKGHQFHQSEGFGQLFETPRILEESIVAVGSDKESVLGRAEASKFDCNRVFWRALANTPEDEVGQRSLTDAFVAYSAALKGLTDIGATADDVARMSGIDEGQQVFRYWIGDRSFFLPAELYQHVTERDGDLLRLLEESARADEEAGTDREVIAEASTDGADGSEREPESASIDLAAIVKGLATHIGPAIREQVGDVVYEATGKRV